MKYKVLVSPGAEQDMKDAFLWYEENRKGLGYDFLLQVNVGLKYIERSPKISKQEYKGNPETYHKKIPL